MNETKCPTTSYKEATVYQEFERIANRESTSSILRRKSREKYEEAAHLENLAKVFDVLPKELEAALNPMVSSYLYGRT
jgi:hypothetical protein